MALCINTSSLEFTKLLESTSIPSTILQAKISIWQEQNNTDKFPTLKQLGIDERENIVQSDLKVVNALESILGVRETIRLNTKENPYIETNLRKTLQGKGVTNQQIDFIFDYMKSNNIQEISTSELATAIAATYSYAIEINTTKEIILNYPDISLDDNSPFGFFKHNGYEYDRKKRFITNEVYYTKAKIYGPNFTGPKEEITEEEYKNIASYSTNVNSSHYSKLTVPGGTNYIENEIATPAITPNIKGHAQFATKNGIGWFRSDDRIPFNEALPTPDNYKYKERRILEVQSDLFQKGRNETNLTNSKKEPGLFFKTKSGQIVKVDSQKEFDKYFQSGELDGTEEPIVKDVDVKNKFLQLLNKDNNWVKFFIKSIIQDSAKKGYEKVLFPSGNTASKVEGHITLEQFKKQGENRIKKLEESIEKFNSKNYQEIYKEGRLKPGSINKETYTKAEAEELYKKVYDNSEIDKKINEINQLKQQLERVDREGFGALKPIYNFYENTVTNILNKTYGKENVKKITDEYGNTWNEVEIKKERDLEKVFLRKATLAKPEYKKGDFTKAEKYLREKLGMTANEIVRVQGLVDGESFGKMLKDGKILLSEEFEEGTEYHEAFHRVWNFYLTPEERSRLLDQFKSDPDYKSKIQYLTKTYPDLTEDDLIEEYFAEDFRDFNLSKPKPSNIFEKIYQDIIDFFGKLFKTSPKDIKQLYKLIDEGRYSKAKKLVENTEVEKNRLVKINSLELNSIEKSELLSSMDFFFSRLLFTPQYLKELNSDIKNIFDLVDGKYTSEEVKVLYENVVYEILTELENSNTEAANKILEAYDETGEPFSAFGDLIKEHLKRLSAFNIKTKEPKEDDISSDVSDKKLAADTNNDSSDITSDENKEDNDNQGRSTLDILPAIEFNTKDNMPKAIKLLISALPNFVKNNKGEGVLKRSSYLNIAKSGSWDTNVNILKNSLATLPADVDIFIDKLNELSENYPQFKFLIKYLGSVNSEEFVKNVSLNSDKKYLYDLRRAFVSEFALTKYNFYTAILNNEGNFVFVAANKENFVNSLRNSFEANFEKKYSDYKQRGLLADKSIEYVNQIISTPNYDEKFDMLGIDNYSNISDEAYDILTKEVDNILNLLSKNKKDVTNIYSTYNSRFNKIVNLITEGFADNTELQFMNLEGKPVYLINLNTYQTIIIDTINYYIDKINNSDMDDISKYNERRKVLRDKLPHVFKSFQSENSKWIEKLYQGNKLEYAIIEGLKSSKIDKAIHVSDLKEGDLMSLNVNMTLSGISPSAKHSDRSVFPVYKIGSQSNILNKQSSVNNIIDDAYKIIRGYLKDEIKKFNSPFSKIYSNINNTLKNAESYKEKSFFGNIVTYNTFLNLVKNPEGVNDKVVENQIKAFLKTVIERDVQLFKDYRLDEPYEYTEGSFENEVTKKIQSIGLSSEILKKDFNNNWTLAVSYAALDSFLQKYEHSILFTGDVTGYKNSTDYPKRLNTQSSTGKVSIIGKEIDTYVEQLNLESEFKIGDTSYIYKEGYNINEIRELVLSDPEVTSYYYSSIRKAIKDKLLKDFKGNEAKAEEYAEKYSKAYRDYTENDGFSYINIFMAREFEIRSDEWNDAKQRNFDLQIKFLNNGYDLNVIKDDLEVPEDENITEWLFKNYGPLTIKKPQYVGPNDFTTDQSGEGVNIVGGRKTAYLPLMPTAIYDVALNAVHEFMLVNSIDVIHMKGAAKFGIKQERNIYTEGNWNLEEITKNQIGILPWKYMKNQVKIANIPKGNITSSTQARKNILEGFFDKGVPLDYTEEKDWNSLSEEQKKSASPIYSLVKKYEDIQNTIINRSINSLLEELNGVIYNDEIKISVDKLKKVLVESATSRNSPDNVIEAAEDFLNEIKYIELIPNSGKIQPILNSLVTNRVLVQKRLGDMVPQAAVTGFESGPRQYNKDGSLKSDSDVLKFYEINKDGSISPAEIIIPITPDILKSAFNKYKTRNIIEAVQKLNEDIKEGNLEVIAKGLRIPNQQFSSNDVFKIKRFLLPLNQGMAVVPSELVAKTGGDFDIDKISLYYYHLDKNGNKIKYYETHTDELFNVFLRGKGIYDKKGLSLKDLKEEFKATPVEEINSKEALENHFLDIEIEMLLHPSQIKNLYSPVADTPLAQSKKDYVPKQPTPMTDIFIESYNVEASIRFVSGKGGVGQLATWINFTDLAQRHGLKLNPKYPNISIPISGFENSYDLGNNLSNSKDNINESIAQVLSALLTSQVDLVKDPYAAILNIVNQTLDTISYMVLRGVPVNLIIDLLKHPSVSEFLKGERINQSLIIESTGSVKRGGKKLSNNDLKASYLKVPLDYTPKVLTEEQIKSHDKKYETDVLSIFLTLRDQSKQINKIKRYYSPDTKYLKDRNSVVALNDLFVEISNPDFIITPDEQSKLITNNSIIEPFYKGRELYNELYKKFFFIDKLTFYKGAKKRIVDSLNLKESDKIKFYNKIDQHLITFILQNFYSELNDNFTFDRLMKGKESVAKILMQIKDKPEYKNNLFLQNLYFLINKKGIDNFRSFKGKGTTSFINEQSESFNELDEYIKFILEIGNLFQSGTYNSIFQLNKFLPYSSQKRMLSDINDIITALLSDMEFRSEIINEFMHKFLLANKEYIPDKWKFIEKYNNPVREFYPYAMDTNGKIYLVVDKNATRKVVEPIGTYQGVDYRKEVPITNNFSEKFEPISIVTVNDSKVLKGDIFKFEGIPVIPTNLGGVHGAGLAQLAKNKGLLQKGDGNFKATDKVVQLPVKKVWSDTMYMNNNIQLLEKSLLSLKDIALANPNNTYLLPLAGLGHGEGKLEDIMPLLIDVVASIPNINLVIPTLDVNIGRQSTVRKDSTKENLPKIMQMLINSGLLSEYSNETNPVTESGIYLPTEGLKKINPYATKPGAKSEVQDGTDKINIDNFDSFFPQFADISIDEKVQMLRSMSQEEIDKICKIG